MPGAFSARAPLMARTPRRTYLDARRFLCACASHGAHHAALGTEGRDEGTGHQEPGIDEEFPDLADAADVLHPVLVGEAQIAVQPVTHIVAVERIGVVTGSRQLALDDIGNRRLAGTGQAGTAGVAGWAGV